MIGVRFYFVKLASGLWWVDDVALLPISSAAFCRWPLAIIGEESHHAVKVLRLKPGDTVEVCDGKGLFATGQISFMQSREVQIIAPELKRALPPQPRVLLLLGALAGHDMDDLIPALNEVGLDELHVYLPPQVAKHRIADNALARWQRLNVAALKQCKRSYLMDIQTHASFENALQKISLRRVFDCALTETALPPRNCCCSGVLPTRLRRFWYMLHMKVVHLRKTPES